MGSHEYGGRKHSNRLNTHEWSKIKHYNIQRTLSAFGIFVVHDFIIPV